MPRWPTRSAVSPPDRAGAVLDGRDIGTVICPAADVKIFVTASPQTRAQRRALELARAGEPADFAVVLLDITRRDERDSSRAVAPLRPASDALTLDTTTLDAEAAFAAALTLVEARRHSESLAQGPRPWTGSG